MNMMTDQEAEDRFWWDSAAIHFHDGSQTPIAWNDVQAVLYYNQYQARVHEAGLRIKAPEVATEGYNIHRHTSDYDGGVIPGAMGLHDHRDNAHGGFAFAVYHPGTAVPQQPWEA